MSTEDNIKRLIGAADVETRADEAEWNQFARKAHGALFMRRAGIAVGTVALIAIGVFGAVTLRPTSDPGPAPIRPADSQSPGVEETPQPNTTASAQEQYLVPDSEQELWFVSGEKLFWGTTIRGGSIATNLAGDDPLEQAAAFWISELLRGPQGPDVEAGATTIIPEGTRLLGVRVDSPAMFVDLSSEFQSGGGSLSMRMRVAQIVYMATQFEGVDSVRILIDGKEVESIGGEGFIVHELLERRDPDFQDLAPNVVLEDPRPNDELASGDDISGFANVFEANVSINITDNNGKVIYEHFTTATCGSGCWGDFMEAVDFKIDAPQEGRLNVLTYSAEDGSPQDEISIPVMLVP